MRNWSGQPPPIDRWRPQIEPPERIEGLRFYHELAQAGYEYGPAFRGVQTIWRDERNILAAIHLPEAAGSAAEFLMHPALLDACFQAMLGIGGSHESKNQLVALPASIDRMGILPAARWGCFRASRAHQAYRARCCRQHCSPG